MGRIEAIQLQEAPKLKDNTGLNGGGRRCIKMVPDEEVQQGPTGWRCRGSNVSINGSKLLVIMAGFGSFLFMDILEWGDKAGKGEIRDSQYSIKNT